MNTASRFVLWIAAPVLAAAALTYASRGWAADAAPVAPPIPIAHSALLTVDATETEDSLALRIRHVANQTPIESKDVTVSVDGKSETVTAQADGTLLLPIKDLRGDGERQFDIVVAHDGIREILTGKLALPKVSSTTADLWRDHKQIAWWILNIAIVLIAAIMFSRRTSS
ncbi:MAG: hypothetical protein JWM63_3963 [Gammaproteobacteria bacterium]|jgi:hypothetical protein|nr:hypothetical protein [Gammaproteobacteria bacterium]